MKTKDLNKEIKDACRNFVNRRRRKVEQIDRWTSPAAAHVNDLKETKIHFAYYSKQQ